MQQNQWSAHQFVERTPEAVKKYPNVMMESRNLDKLIKF